MERRQLWMVRRPQTYKDPGNWSGLVGSGGIRDWRWQSAAAFLSGWKLFDLCLHALARFTLVLVLRNVLLPLLHHRAPSSNDSMACTSRSHSKFRLRPILPNPGCAPCMLSAQAWSNCRTSSMDIEVTHSVRHACDRSSCARHKAASASPHHRRLLAIDDDEKRDERMSGGCADDSCEPARRRERQAYDCLECTAGRAIVLYRPTLTAHRAHLG